MDLLTLWRDHRALDRWELIPVARMFLLRVVERVLAHVGRPLTASDREGLHHVAYRRWLDARTDPPRFRPHEETDKFARPGYHLTFKSQTPSAKPLDRVLLNPWPTEGHLSWQLGLQVDFTEAGSLGRWLPEAILVGVHAWGVDMGSRLHRGSYSQGNPANYAVVWKRLEEAGVPDRVSEAWRPFQVRAARHEDLADAHLLLGIRVADPGRWTSLEDLEAHCARLLATLWPVLPPPPEVVPVERRTVGSTAVDPPRPPARDDRAAGDPPRLARRLARWFADQGLEYSPDQIAAVYTALKTKGFVILAGLTGTGKTRLATELARLLSSREPCFQAVRPDWRDATPVLGYHNPFTQRYQETPILQFLRAAEAEWEGEAPAEPAEALPVERLAQLLREQLDPGRIQTLREGLARWRGDPADWADEDVAELWYPRRNAMGSVGQAPRLRCDLGALRRATQLLADRDRGLGERYRDAVLTLAQGERVRPVARVLRALAAVEPGRVAPVFQLGYLKRLLRLLGIDRPFDVGAVLDGDGDPAGLDACWDALQERLRDVVGRAGLRPDDVAAVGAAAWVLARYADGGTGDRETPGEARPYFLTLDEMNLARVEYYLADLLSAMETDREQAIDLLAGAPGGGSGPAGSAGDGAAAGAVRVRLAPNVYILGTVNIDETTFTFSPKVLDRAFTVAFRDVRLGPDYPPEPVAGAGTALSDEERALLRSDFARDGRFAGVDKDLVRAAARSYPWIVPALAELNEQLKPHDLHFGYRVVDEILAFVYLGLESPLRDGFDSAAAEVSAGAGREVPTQPAPSGEATPGEPDAGAAPAVPSERSADQAAGDPEASDLVPDVPPGAHAERVAFD